MSTPLDQKLRHVIHEVTAKIHRFQTRALGEQNTKASLIDPILEALGWDIRDPDEVQREFKPTSKIAPLTTLSPSCELRDSSLRPRDSVNRSVTESGLHKF